METPPFAARAIAGAHADPAQAAANAPAEATPRRARLADLDAHFHCSVIGTCLGTGALRKVVRRLVPDASAQDSDVDIHHDAVSLAMDGGAGAKAIGKALDEQHAATIRRFAAAADAEALARLWADALKSGEIPGAYWALMTHPLAGVALRNRAFGDVHMLSHLVGAANRADIRRLVALEKDNAELQEHNDRLQARLQDAAAERDAQLAQARAELAEAKGRAERLAAQLRALPDDASSLQRQLDDGAGQLALQAGRRELAERDALTARARLADALGQLARSASLNDELRDEVVALEAELAATRDTDAGDGAGPASPLAAALRGVRLLYVGGRPSTLAAIRALVEQAGAEWLHHDGGMEDRKGLLAAMLPRAHRVVFPVDCIDHDSMQQLKRQCARHGLPYRPLCSASVASFVAAMAAPDDDAPLANGAALASRFCMRHG